MTWAFVHFDDPGALQLVADPQRAWATAHGAELDEGYAVASLSSSDIEASGVTAPDAETNILGAMGRAVYTSTLDDVAAGVVTTDKPAIHESAVSFEILESDGQQACFLDGTCDQHVFWARSVDKVPVLGETTRTYRTEMRWETDADGERFLALRQVAPDPMTFHLDLLAVDQQYGVSLVWPTTTGALRVEAFWIDARILGTLTLPEGFAVRQAVDQMQTTASEMDAWVLDNAL
ncbi:MAG: hypothetical protein RLZZ383_2973 [Pseudomonadota bacterium]|jgi:hypothetical protein